MKNYIGNKYGMLEVIDQKRENGRTLLLCKCNCGNVKWMRKDYVNNAKSCGCLAKSTEFKQLDLTGKTYGYLTAIKATDKKASNGSIIWECKCKCGNITHVTAGQLTQGRIKSCGCLRKPHETEQGKALGKATKEQCVENTNLRNLTAKKPRNNTSGYKGVTWDNSRKKWVAQLVFKGYRYYLGRFDNIEEAVKARKDAEQKYFEPILEKYKEGDNNDK